MDGRRPNRAVSLLRSVYRRPCVDHDGLRDPVDLWLAGGGKFHRKTRRKISTPAEVLPCWRAGIEAEVLNPTIRGRPLVWALHRDAREEVFTLRWERVDMTGLTFRVDDTKTRVPLELPITHQLVAILERRLAEGGDYPAHVRDWVFPSPTSATGHVQDPHHLYGRISETGGAKFWFHGLRNCGCAERLPGHGRVEPCHRAVAGLGRDCAKRRSLRTLTCSSLHRRNIGIANPALSASMNRNLIDFPWRRRPALFFSRSRS